MPIAKLHQNHGGRPVDAVTPLLPAVRRFVSKRAAPAEIDDLVQEVALRMQTRSGDLPIGNLEGYVFQVARSVLTDHARRDQVRARSSHVSLEEFHHPVEVRSPERVLDSKERLQRLVAAVGTLPDRTRQAFVLHRFEEMSYAAVARHMGISVSAVEKHIMKAIRTLAATVD
ncbi:RNA polymerase sigma-70 factor, ECF subfamily [Sphingomonas gellani]|uniref:RNA polymerase sigma-70 factor, ECF subfamily n=1 Tax=Sphingomonas gellani TaxID=1166340 RepID=A0A1H8CTB8_9SPHN|nr:sigma-70 family RNA polymerase sigma factor [Sphingomonas gellani]SEM98295.1 RNA polymerase sigma-70 factor, ECF subfamily [Sphingomonas gellani]